MTISRVANLGFDGSTVTLTIDKAHIRAITASYGDKLETSWLPAMGAQDQGEQSDGTYKTDEVKIKMSSVVFRRDFMPLYPTTAAGNVRKPIVIGNVHPDLGSDSDLLEECRCVNWATAVDNSNKVQEVELAFTTKQVRWTDKRITINRLKVAGT